MGGTSADDPQLADYNSDAWTAVVTKVSKELAPSVLLLGQTDIGRDLAPRLVARLDGGLAMDCLDLKIDPETKLLAQTRPVFGGNAQAVIVTRVARPQIATVRAKAMAPAERDEGRQGEVITVDTGIDASTIKARVIDRVREEAEGPKLEDAEVVVSGGRGIGSAENFSSIRELARVLGGAVGATRAACEEGWVPSTLQVGQTGKIVSPNLYVAVALSGAMQHLAGCSGAKHIVAINKDPEANIFKAAHYGVVGDYREAVPAFLEKCKELLES